MGSGLLAAEKQFRRITDHKQIPALIRELDLPPDSRLSNGKRASQSELRGCRYFQRRSEPSPWQHQPTETAGLAIFLLRDKREFTEVVILERPLGIGRVVQSKCPRDMDFKRAGFDKAIELLERRGRVLAVVALDS